MKLTAPQDVLAAVCGWVTATTRIAKTTPVTPALAGLHLTATDDGTLTVSGTDLDTSATARLDAEVGEPGTALIPARVLAAAVGALPDRPVDLACDGTRMTVTAGPVTYTLPALAPGDYPALPAASTPLAEFGADALTVAITQAASAASRDDTLPVLTAIHLSLHEDGTATLAATDRYRLAVATCPATPIDPPASALGSLLIPARDLAALTRHLTAPTISLALSADDALAGFHAASRQVTTRLLAGEYPAWSRLISAESPATVTADLATLAAAVKRAAVVAERNTAVSLTFTAAEALIESGTGDEATLAETLPVTLDGDPAGIAFNPGYLLDTLTAIAATGTTAVRIGITSPAKPAIVTPAQPVTPVTCTHLLMPLRTPG
jgi:DNA polymerase III subunit beta